MFYKVIGSIVLFLLLTLLTAEDVVADGETGSPAIIYSNASRIYIPFETGDTLGEVVQTELYFRVDNLEWKRWAEAVTGINYFEFMAPRDGIYDFAIISTDEAGNRKTLSRDDKGDATVVIDTQDPDLKVFTPGGQGDKVYAGGSLSMGWKVEDLSFKTISIRYSLDGGKTFKATNRDKNEDTLTIHLPHSDIETVPFELRAEDRAGHAKVVGFNVKIWSREPLPKDPRQKTAAQDSPPPTNPKELTNPLQLPIAYAAKVGPSGLSRVELWYSRITGHPEWKKNWMMYATSQRINGRFLFEAPEPGQYAFYTVTVSKAGSLSSPRPIPDQVTEPEQIRWIDPYAPIVRIIAPSGTESYQAKVRCMIKWEADDFNFIEKPITIEYTQNGKDWVAIAKDLGNAGSYEWTTPDDRQGSFRLRIAATDLAGNKTIKVSNRFVIDSEIPTIVLHPHKLKPIYDRATDRPLVDGNEKMNDKQRPRRSALKKNPYDRPTAQRSKVKPVSKMNRSEKAWLLFNHGASLRKAGRYDEAIKRLNQALKFAPNHAGIINEIGLVYYSLRNYKAALVRFTQAVQTSPREPFFQINQISSYLRLSDLDGAALATRKLLETDPSIQHSRQVVSLVVSGFKKTGRSTDAVAFIQGLLENTRISDDLREHLQRYLVKAMPSQEGRESETPEAEVLEAEVQASAA